MARPSAAAIVATVAVALAMLTGCTGYADPEDVATYQPAGDGGADALLEGILVREDGCTYVDGPAGERTLPVFAAGTVTWSDDTLIVRNLSYQVGETAGFGGGEYGAGSTATISVPEACDDSVPRWAVN